MQARHLVELVVHRVRLGDGLARAVETVGGDGDRQVVASGAAADEPNVQVVVEDVPEPDVEVVDDIAPPEHAWAAGPVAPRQQFANRARNVGGDELGPVAVAEEDRVSAHPVRPALGEGGGRR